jgi:hypothetical protein
MLGVRAGGGGMMYCYGVFVKEYHAGRRFVCVCDFLATVGWLID